MTVTAAPRPPVELVAVRIERWQLLEGSDRYEQRGWVVIDTIEAVPNPDVALSVWFDHQDRDQPSALYQAVLPNGHRSDRIRWPDATRGRRR